MPRLLSNLPDRPECVANYLGVWLAHAPAAAAMLAGIRASAWQPRFHRVHASEDMPEGDCTAPEPVVSERLNGVEVVYLTGELMKGDSKFGGTSTVRARRAIRAAIADDNCRAIMLYIDSPGGTCAGTRELAADVALAAGAKPALAYIEDMGASAAYWIAAACGRVVCNAGALVGSIGAMCVLYDTSGAYEREGVRVIPVASGPLKAALADGVKISEAAVAEMQGIIDFHAADFKAAVAAARGLTPEAVATVATGEVFPAPRALQLGLVDAVMTADEAFASLSEAAPASSPADEPMNPNPTQEEEAYEASRLFDALRG